MSRVEEPENFWPWLAGFIDGEGTLQVWRHDNGGYIGYRPNLSITNNSRETLEFIESVLGAGGIRRGDRKVWHYVVTANTLRSVLPKILPFLRVKKRQAELLQEYLDLTLKKPVFGRRNNGCNSFASNPQKKRMLEIALELKKLNGGRFLCQKWNPLAIA